MKTTFSAARTAASAALALSIFGSPAFGDTILYDNLNASADGSDSVTFMGPLYDSFSTGSSALSLTDVKVKLDASRVFGAVKIGLYRNNSTSPGSLLTNIGLISDSALAANPANYDFVLAAPYALAAKTRYWVGLSSSNGSVAEWTWSSDTSGVGVASEYLHNMNGTFSNSGGPYQMRVTGKVAPATPEPGAYAMLASLGLTGATFLRRRRAR